MDFYGRRPIAAVVARPAIIDDRYMLTPSALLFFLVALLKFLVPRTQQIAVHFLYSGSNDRGFRVFDLDRFRGPLFDRVFRRRLIELLDQLFNLSGLTSRSIGDEYAIARLVIGDHHLAALRQARTT